jgi:hypothetical protein
MAHYEHSCAMVLHGSHVERERSTVKPPGPRLLVIVKSEPNMFELADVGVVAAPTQINDMRYPEGSKFFGVSPGGYRTSER